MIDEDNFVATVLTKMANQKSSAPSRITANKLVVIAALKKHALGGATATYSGSCDSGQIDEIFPVAGKLSIGQALSGINVDKVLDPAEFPDEQVELEVSGGRWSGSSCEVATTKKSMSLHEAVEHLLEDWLDSNHPGWENNDGADGRMDLDADTGEVTFTHNEHYMSTETSEETL